MTPVPGRELSKRIVFPGDRMHPPSVPGSAPFPRPDSQSPHAATAGGARHRTSPHRILVLRGGALGDFVLTLPVLELLNSSFPEASLELIAHPRIASLAKPPFVSTIRSIEDAALAPFFVPSASLPTEMVGYFGRFHWVISYLHDPDRVFETNVRRCGVETFLPAFSMPINRHASLEWLLPLKQLGLSTSNFRSRIQLESGERLWGQSWWQNAPGAPRVVIHPGSGSPRKNWPLQLWAQIGRVFLERFPQGTLAYVGGEADVAQIESLQKDFSLRTSQVRFAWDLEPRALAALLFASDLFLGHDSGVSHVAAAVDVRSILLFGPTDPNVWAPTGPRVRVLKSPGASPADIPLSSVQSALEMECEAGEPRSQL